MGRSGGKPRVSRQAGVSRSVVSKTKSLEEFLSLDRSGQFEGDFIDYPEEIGMALKANDPGLTMAGMAEVRSVEFLPDENLWLVKFKDGQSALVDLEKMSVNGPDDESLLRGALAAALGREMSLSNPKTPAEKALADMYQRIEKDDPEAFRNAALSALAVIEERGDAPNLTDDNLSISSDDEEDAAFDPNSYQGNSSVEKLASELAEIRKRGGQNQSIDESLAILGRQTNEEAEIERFETQEDVFWQGAMALANYDEEAAKELIPDLGIVLIEVPKTDENGNPIHVLDENGEKIPHLDDNGKPLLDPVGNVVYECEPQLDEEGKPIMQSVGSFDLDDDLEEKLQQIDAAAVTQGRFFLSFGRPGTGKNAIEEQYAALIKAPYTEFVFNGATDMSILIGGDGLEYKPAYDENGNVIGGGSESVVVQGPLARALAQPGITSLQEVIEKSEDFTKLNAALGSDPSDPTKRVLTIESSKGTFSYKVHPDNYIFASFNQGEEDARMEQSTHERAGMNLVYDVPEAEVFAKRLGSMITNVMSRSENVPSEIKRTYEAKEMLPFAEIREALQEAYETGNDDFVTAPEPRAMVRAINQFVYFAYNGDSNPAKKFRNCFHYCLRTSEDKDASYRDDLLDKIMTQQDSQLKRLANSIKKSNPKYAEAEDDSQTAPNNNAGV